MKNKILQTTLTENQIALFYLGQEGFIIKANGKYLLIDAYLSDYVDKNCCTDEVKWERLYPAPVAAEDLDFVDYVFCTHSHFDHADPDTLSILVRVNQKAKYIVPPSLADTICSYGISRKDIICAEPDKAIELDDFVVTPVPAAHEEIHFDHEGYCCEVGYKIFVNGIMLFHAGDCCIYDGLAQRLLDVDIAMLPINGRDYYRLSNDIIGNMDAKEAALLAREIDAKLLIPIHFDLYAVNNVSPAAFVDCLLRTNAQQAFHIFSPGERYLYET